MSDEEPAYVMFKIDGFESLLSMLHETFGSGGDAIIYNMSKQYGETVIHSRLPEIPSDPKQRSTILATLSDQFESQGWGRLSLEEIDMEQGLAKVELKNNPFKGCTGPDEYPVCYFIRGTIAGILSAIFGVDMRVNDVDCSEKDNGVCRFLYEFD